MIPFYVDLVKHYRIHEQLNLQVHSLNWSHTFMILKVSIEIRNMGAFGCLDIRCILIINVKHETMYS
jgi:hypothetical protein